MEWDTAAGDAVLRAAGGGTRTLDGEPLTYGKRNQPDDSDFANPNFIAARAGWNAILSPETK
jgi:3'(2'), 5'-bisphosphate nucleotidase